jgi:hypothetical protein
VEAIRACFDCAQACTADANLSEPNLQMMVRCIRLCLDCTDVCLATGGILSRQTAFEPVTARTTLQVCIQACKVYGDDCQEHARRGMLHCQICMEACRRCEQACNNVLSLLPSSLPA